MWPGAGHHVVGPQFGSAEVEKLPPQGYSEGWARQDSTQTLSSNGVGPGRGSTL